MMNNNAELPGVGLKLQSKVSIHRLVSSVWNMMMLSAMNLERRQKVNN